MKNFEKYKDIFKTDMDSSTVYVTAELPRTIINDDLLDYAETKDGVRDILFNWLYEDYKEPLLTDGEKGYLETIIGPVIDQIVSTNEKLSEVFTIKKDKSCLSIFKENTVTGKRTYCELDLINHGYKFKNLENGVEYTIKELGLFYTKKPSLLTDEERNYLNAVIKPFRDKVVRLDDVIFDLKIVFYDGKYISIPKYGMFKNLKSINGQSYSLEEFGL